MTCALKDELTPAMWKVYFAHCRFRNHQRGVSRASREKIAAYTGLSSSGVKNATAKLRCKGWILVDDLGVHLLVGDFSPVDKRRPTASDEAARRTQSKPPEPQMRRQGPHLRPGADIDRARDSDQPKNQPLNQQTHTSPGGGGAGGRGDAPAARAYVSGPSGCSDSEVAAYAEAYGLGLGWRKTAKRTAEDDEHIRQFAADPEGFMRRHPPRSHAPPQSKVESSMSAVEKHIAKVKEKERARTTGAT